MYLRSLQEHDTSKYGKMRKISAHAMTEGVLQLLSKLLESYARVGLDDARLLSIDALER